MGICNMSKYYVNVNTHVYIRVWEKSVFLCRVSFFQQSFNKIFDWLLKVISESQPDVFCHTGVFLKPRILSVLHDICVFWISYNVRWSDLFCQSVIISWKRIQWKKRLWYRSIRALSRILRMSHTLPRSVGLSFTSILR